MSAASAIHAVTMPKWGIEMTEGTLTQWSVREGQPVTKGDPLLEVETDKIINTVESPASGVVRRIVAAAGDVKPVGALIAVLTSQSVTDADVDAFIAGFRGAEVSFEPHTRAVADAAMSGEGGATSATPAAASVPEVAADTRVSPIARRLAESLGVDLAQITGTGRNGRISKEDVEQFAALRGLAGENAATRTKLSATRLSIARRLTESKQTIPHYRTCIDVDVGLLQAHRKAAATRFGLRISLNDMLVHAVGAALARHPVMNSHLQGDELVQFARADVAIAVATQTGLLTPVVRGANLLSLPDIARSTAELAERARQGRLTRNDVSGATFTISNLGMFGLARFDAIIDPPQVAILAAGAATERVVVRAGAPAIASVMTLTLSADHRVIDGATSAAFLASLRELIEAPDR